MIQLKPKIENSFVCPECRSELPVVNEVLIQSVHVVADCTCNKCNFRFYQILPVGHNVGTQLSIAKESNKFYHSPDTEPWLFESIVKAHQGMLRQDVKIEKVVFRNHNDVVILNTLDYLYGHVLLKIYNALHHLDHEENFGLILIIPKMFEWLIPRGCAEAWIVDLKLSELVYHYHAIQEFASGQFGRFDSIYLSRAYSHPDFTTIDIARLTGVKPFDLKSFLRRRPTVTFVLREDRWWFASIADCWFYRICRRLKALSWGGRVLSIRQNRLVKRTIKVIRKKLPAIDFYVVGLGVSGNFSGYAADERERATDAVVERAWCEIYARSHVVVGVHGSNMLLPTALAAGCVEVLPQERYGNMVQDISVRYNDRMQLFFYRFADQYSSPGSVAAKAAAILTHYDTYHKNMCRNLYKT